MEGGVWSTSGGDRQRPLPYVRDAQVREQLQGLPHDIQPADVRLVGEPDRPRG